MKKRVGVYAGSFNPFHSGHYNILQQAKKVFDIVIIAVGQNPEKDNTQKVELPKTIHKHIYYYSGLLSDALEDICKEWNTQVTLIRGLRNGADLAYEQNQIQFIKGMYPKLNVVFFVCDKEFEHISSSALRALKKVSEEEYLKYTYFPREGGITLNELMAALKYENK